MTFNYTTEHNEAAQKRHGESPGAIQARMDEYERNANGTNDYHVLTFTRSLLFTDGMKLLCNLCSAFWLADLVASHQPAIKRKLAQIGERNFQVWRISLSPTEDQPQRGIAEAWTDTPDAEGSTLLARQVIPYTDFPLSSYEFWIEEGGPNGADLAMLKGER